MKRRNIFSNLPSAATKEVFTTLAKTKSFKIERIVSKGHATPKGKWLVSTKAEWVIVLRGRGRLIFKKGLKEILLNGGDYLFIPPKCYHRVDWTDPKQKTVWLAVQ